MPQRPITNRFWLIAAIGFIAFVWLLKPMLLPFVAASAIAYFLNPVVNELTHYKFPRWAGALMVLLGFVVIVGFMLVLIVPLFRTQIDMLLNAIPSYIDTLRTHTLPWLERRVGSIAPHDVEKLKDAAGQYAGDAVGVVGSVLKDIVTSGLALFDILSLLVITPIVAFYLLRDWPKVTEAIDALIPRKHYKIIHRELDEIDRTLSGFIRGQALVCLSLGLFYSLGLSAVGLNSGAAIGIIAGLLSFIPYVGSTFGWMTSLGLGLVQFDDGLHIGLIVAVFVIGQTLEGYVLTPKLVGDRVRLHPVWILFALFAGGSLMGFVGVLIAVPVAAVVGVLTRFGLRYYKSSRMYAEEIKP